MPRLVHQNPKYRQHNSRQAIVIVGGHDVYLGSYGSAASRHEYDRVVGEWLANGRRWKPDGDIAVSEVVAAFWKHAQGYYREPAMDSAGAPRMDADGKTITVPGRELGNFVSALGPLRRLYGHTPARDFGPLSLKAIRQHMIGLGWCRRTINRQVSRIRQMFKWAAENELVPGNVHHALAAVSGLRIGRSEARETAPIKPMPDELIVPVLPYLPEPVRAMVTLQLLTGMRPGEVCVMRGCDLDMSESLWKYTPLSHKTMHHGHPRVIYLAAALGLVVQGVQIRSEEGPIPPS